MILIVAKVGTHSLEEVAALNVCHVMVIKRLGDGVFYVLEQH